MASFRPVEEGDLIAAEDYNAIAERLERFANLSVSRGHVRLWDGPDGRHLALHVPGETLALLSGSTSPYSFQEVDEDASGAFVVRGVGDSCSSCAYEVNGASGLGGTVQRIVWTEAGDWRFQAVRYGGAPCDDSTRICLTLTSSGCTGLTAYGANIEARDGSGTLVGACTADGTILSLTLNSGGSFYTNGTSYSLGFSGGGGSGAAGTFDVVSGHVANVVLTSGGTGYTSAPTVGFPGAGGGSGANVTAVMGAKCCINVPTSGGYTVTSTIPGATPLTTSVNVTCGQDNNATAAFSTNALGTACFNFIHCGYDNGGDTIVISKAGSPVTSVTTDGSGQACLRLGTGNYTYILTTPQGSTKSGSFSVTSCSITNVNAGLSVTQVCVVVRTTAPATCTATVTISNSDTFAVVGTDILTTAFDGANYIGQVCVTVSELVSDVTFGFNLEVAFPNFSGNTANIPLGCYSATSPFFADFHEGFGAPC